MPLTRSRFKFPEANAAPALSMLLRHEPRFSADLGISGMSVVLFARALDMSSDVIESTADSESN